MSVSAQWWFGPQMACVLPRPASVRHTTLLDISSESLIAVARNGLPSLYHCRWTRHRAVRVYLNTASIL